MTIRDLGRKGTEAIRPSTSMITYNRMLARDFDIRPVEQHPETMESFAAAQDSRSAADAHDCGSTGTNTRLYSETFHRLKSCDIQVTHKNIGDAA